MALLSEAVRRLQPSATIALTDRARAVRAAGRDVISLSAGEPDFDTPDHICAAAEAAIREGRTRYTPPAGIPELREAVARKLRDENAIAADADGVIVSAGGKQCIFNALTATLGAGDEVVIPAPFWVSYPEIVRFCGASPVPVQTGAAGGYKMTPEALEAAITSRTRWLILNSPCNPTGAGYGRDELRGLAEVLRRHPDVWVLSDEIYEKIVFEPFVHHSIAGVDPDIARRTLVVNGVSKAYAMTGWRIGYAAGPKTLIDAMIKVQGQSTTNACSVSQWAALAALTGPQDYLAVAREAFRTRRDRVLRALNECEGLACPEPQGAFYLFPSIAELIGRQTHGGQRIETDEAFVSALLDETGVATVFGAAFGASPNFRLSYAAHEKDLAEACARIAGFCSALE